MQGALRRLNELLRTEPSLYQRDFDPAGFAWVVGDDRDQSVFAFMRFGEVDAAPLLVVCNFTPVPRHGYGIGLPGASWREIFNSDAAGYGGGDIGNAGVLAVAGPAMHGHAGSVTLNLPPLATIILRQEG